MIATAKFDRKEYNKSAYKNMRYAAELVNHYFRQPWGLRIEKDNPFSFLRAMFFFGGSDWQTVNRVRGGGACEIATLLYRAVKDIPYLEVKAIPHTRMTYRQVPDLVAVYYVREGDKRNKDLVISVLDDHVVSIRIDEDEQGNFTAEVKEVGDGG